MPVFRRNAKRPVAANSSVGGFIMAKIGATPANAESWYY